MGSLRTLSSALLVAFLVGTSVSIPVRAAADIPTTIGFSHGPLEAAFGDDWTVVLTVSIPTEAGGALPAGPQAGTVDIYLSGIAGAYATGLPIQPDGNVYFSQPLHQPLLPAGTHEVRAIFTPAPGTSYNSSQTGAPIALTITSLEALTAIRAEFDPATSYRAVITAIVTGSYVESTGGAPGGFWELTVEDSRGDVAFSATVAQPHGATEPLRVEVDAPLIHGSQYTVRSKFAPAPELGGGLTITQSKPVTLDTPEGTIGEVLLSPVAIDPSLLVIFALIVVGLLACITVVAIRTRARHRSGSKDVSDDSSTTVGSPMTTVGAKSIDAPRHDDRKVEQ